MNMNIFKRICGPGFSKARCIVSFFVVFFLYHVFVGGLFPTDENNVLQAPDWYPFVGIAVSLVCSILAGKRYKIKLKRYSRYSPKKKHGLYLEALNAVNERKSASASLVQRCLNIDFEVALDLIEKMKEDGKIAQDYNGFWVPAKYATATPMEEYSPTIRAASIDEMSGTQFEQWCATLLELSGFFNVTLTAGSGDQGTDILAEKGGIRYAIQCKCYSSDLGNTPVQEINAGKEIYNCHIGVVMTNRYFTKGAKQAADATKVLLWDRDTVEKMAADVGLSI